MSILHKVLKPSFRNYTLTLCVFYLMLVFFFHSNLDPNSRQGRSEDNVEQRQPVQKIDSDVEQRQHVQKIDGEVEQRQHVQKIGSDVEQREHVQKIDGDVIEEKPNRPTVRINPDSQAGRFLEEYRSMYAVNAGENYAPNNSNWRDIKPNASCIGTPIRETHEFHQLAANMYVYSVFWDPRPNDFDNMDLGVYLRVITVIERATAAAKAPLYCIFIDNAGTHIPVPATYYEMCENHGRQFGGYILSCPVPEQIYGYNRNRPPCRIRISGTSDYDHKLSRDFKVVNTVPVDKQNDFSICVAPLYGDIPHSMLIEFMELSSILGANHVTFYDYAVSPETMSLLNYYESINRVTIIPWKITPSMDVTIWYHGQLVSILDCLYRNMAVTKYLSFNDMDEYIMPYNYTNWRSMVHDLDAPDRCAYQFNSVFVDPVFQNQYEGPNDYRDLRTLTNTARSLVTSSIRTKCMVKPQLIFEAGIHHISKPILAHLQTIRMNLPTAVLHHHRVCQPNFGMNCHDTIQDNIVPKRYSEGLYKQYSRTQTHFANLLKGVA